MSAGRVLLQIIGKTAALALLVAFTATTAQAQTVCYVDTGGDDAQNGQTAATANETIAGCLAEGYVDDGTIISIEAGTYNEAVTVTEDVIFEARETGAFNRVLIDDGVTTTANITFQLDSQTATEATFRLGDGTPASALVISGGSVTIDSEGRVEIPDGGTVTRDDDTEVTGAITYLGAANLVYTDNDNSATNVDAGGEFPGDFADGSLNVNIQGGDTLSFSTATGIADLDVAGGSTLDGTITVDAPIDIAGPGSVGSLDVNDDVTISASAEVTDVNIANDNDINFDLGAFTLTVNGDFVRLGGVFESAAGAEMAFRGDESDALFGPGPNFVIGAVSIDKEGQLLEITEDITVNGVGVGPTFTIADLTTVDFAGNQVNIDAGGTEIDGTLTDLSTIVYRTSGTGIRGDGVYGNILVTTGDSLDVNVGATTQEDIRFSGTLTLLNGGITVADLDDDISPFGDDAAVSVNLETAGQAITGPGSFNALDNEYSLEYTGDMAAATRIVGSEFATDDLVNLTFNVENGTVDASGAPAGTISGNVALNDIGAQYTVQLGNDVTIGGSLTVEGDAILDGTVITLQGASNSVEGTVNATIELEDGVTVTGTTDDTLPSTIGSVEVSGDATIEDVQEIDGSVTTNADANLTLGLADDMSVTGDVVLNGASLTLDSDVIVGGSVVANAGTLAFETFDLNLAGSLTGVGDVAYTSSGGALVFTTSGAVLTLSGETIPNVTLETDVTIDLGSAGEISDALVEVGAADIDLAGNDLTLGGEITSDGGSIILATGGGDLILNTANVTLDGNATVASATSIAEGATVTVAAADPEDEWTLTINDDVSLAGTLVLDQNHLTLGAAANLLNAAGTITASTGVVTVSGGAIEVDGALAIENLTTAGATALGATSNGDLTIGNMLTLGAALTETDVDDDLVIGDSATIVVNAPTPLTEAPTFAGAVNLVYGVATDSGNEIPAEGEGTVNDVDVDAAVVLTSDLTVGGTLALAAAISNPDPVNLVLADGATLSLETDNTTALGAADIDATNYTLEYSGPSDVIGDAEFIDGATVTELIIDVDANTITNTLVTGGAEREVNDFTIASGTFDLNGIDFNVSGDLTMAGDDLVNGAVDDVNLTFVGGEDQAWTLDGEFDAVTPGIDIELMKEGTSLVTLSGGDVDLVGNTGDTDHQTLLLSGGILETSGNAEIFLYQDNTTQGFVRTVDELAGEVSHVAGNTTKFIEQGDPFATDRSTRYEFPTGSPDGDYRPYVLIFRETIGSNTFITVNHDDVSPGGTLGLPLQDDGGELIGTYPDYFWLVDATTSLGQAQSVDIELTATEINRPFTDAADLRIIRRFDGDASNNPWSIQGDAADYENIIQVDDGDTTAVVRVINSTGGIVTQGARFTLGLPTSAPIFAADTPDTLTVNEGDVVTDTLSASADIGETVTFSLDGAPDFVTIDADTGILTVAPGDTDAGSYTFNVVADDGTDTSTAQITVIVTDIFSITPAQADTAIALGQTLTIDFDAEGANEGDPITFGIEPDTTAGAAIDAETGVFAFTPAIEQGGMTFSFTAFATNGTDTSSVSFDVTIGSDLAYGDVNNDGGLTLGDVSLVLSAVIGDTTLSAGASLVADVSGASGVSAYDAALMLQCIANEGPTVEDTSVCGFPVSGAGKASAVASSEIAWGDLEGENGTVNLPLVLSGTVRNVYSIDLTANVDLAAVKLTNVKANLPDGWQLAWSTDDKAGTIRVVALGATPISYEGEVARLVFQLDDESAINMTGEAFVNENAAVQLGDVNVVEVPTEFALGDNYPNPFNPTTTFTYSLPEASHVTIQVYDVSGRLVQTLVDAQKDAGRYDVKWNGQNNAGSMVASGLYLYRIEASSFTQVKTMMLVK